MKSKFTTIISNELVDELDENFSPMDGIVAIDQIMLELPLLHRPSQFHVLNQRFGLKPKAHHGRYDWYPLGFSYVQIGDELHVIKLWPVSKTGLFHRRKFNVVLGTEHGEFNRDYEPLRHEETSHE